MISLSGVLLAVFIPTFMRNLRFSKLSEATAMLDSLYRASAAYYATERRVEGRLRRGCLPPSVGPYPEQPGAAVREVDFRQDASGSATWEVLGQLEPLPLRYSYEVQVAEPGCDARPYPAAPAVHYRAIGDLDGDGNLSTIERTASISEDQRTLIPNVPLRVIHRVE